MDDEELEIKGNYDDEDEEKVTMVDFESFQDGRARHRPEVLNKSTKFNFKERMRDLGDAFKGCCQKL